MRERPNLGTYRKACLDFVFFAVLAHKSAGYFVNSGRCYLEAIMVLWKNGFEALDVLLESIETSHVLADLFLSVLLLATVQKLRKQKL